jgi:hypothetical protein
MAKILLGTTYQALGCNKFGLYNKALFRPYISLVLMNRIKLSDLAQGTCL